MKQYGWMYLFSLFFSGLGGYLLTRSILGGSLLIASGFMILFLKWELQSDLPEAKGENK